MGRNTDFDFSTFSGGTPDTELLPRITDSFGVSIDRLFGRDVKESIDLEVITAKHIASFEQEQRIAVAFNHCWTVQKSLCGVIYQEEHETLDAIISKFNNDYIHSQMLYNSGLTQMSLAENLAVLHDNASAQDRTEQRTV